MDLASAEAASAPALTRVRATYVLGLLALINAFSYMDRAALALVLPQLQKDLRLSDATLGLISGLPFSLCYALCTLPAAWLADRWSRRNIIAAGLALWSTMTALSGAVASGVQLAAARFLLGAGESMGNPASVSLIADLFAGARRATAYAVLAASPNVGILIGFPAVTWVLHVFGWRAAFLAAGIPGMALALVFFFTTQEPARSNSASGQLTPHEGVSLRHSIGSLLHTPSYLLITAGGALTSLAIGSMLAWGPMFLTRIHGLSPPEIGLYFGSLRGIVGLCGALFAGIVMNALARRSETWRLWATVCAQLLLFPVDAIFLFSSSEPIWKTALALDAFLNSVMIAGSYMLYVSVARARMRAVAASLYFLTCSLVGLAFGPFIVGYLNDALQARFGTESIRYSMLLTTSSALGAALVTLMAARYWRSDVARAAAAS